MRHSIGVVWLYRLGIDQWLKEYEFSGKACSHYARELDFSMNDESCPRPYSVMSARVRPLHPRSLSADRRG